MYWISLDFFQEFLYKFLLELFQDSFQEISQQLQLCLVIIPRIYAEFFKRNSPKNVIRNFQKDNLWNYLNSSFRN